MLVENLLEIQYSIYITWNYFYFSAFYYKKYFEPVLPALQQLADGINMNGFLSQIRENPDQFKPCFINSSKRLTFDDLMDLIEPNFSPKGTKKYQLELDVYKYFTDALEELDQLGKNFWGPSLRLRCFIWCLIASICWTRQGHSQGKWEALYGLGQNNFFFKTQLIIRVFAPRLIGSFDYSSIINCYFGPFKQQPNVSSVLEIT